MMSLNSFTPKQIAVLAEALSQFVENREEGHSEENTYQLNPMLRDAEELLDEVETHRLQRVGLGFAGLACEKGVADGDTRTVDPVDSDTPSAPRG